MDKDLEKHLDMGSLSWLAVLLTVLFVGLKLTGYITWSWLWVISPMLIGPAVLIVVLFVIVVLAAISTIVEEFFGKKR